MAESRLKGEVTRPCECVSCGDCKGTGRINVPTRGYPEYELESCINCRGYGYSEQCAYCYDGE